MTDALTITAPALPDLAAMDLAAIPTPELRQALSRAIGITAQTLGYLARIWNELERRGEDLSSLRSGLMAYLPMIADGRLEPELVVRCAGQAMLLRAAADLPLETQRSLLTQGLPIAAVGADGQVQTLYKPLERINSHEVRLAFAAGQLRPVADQVAMLADHPARREQKMVLVKVRLSPNEYETLRKRAAAEGKQTQTLAREVLKRAGVI